MVFSNDFLSIQTNISFHKCYERTWNWDDEHERQAIANTLRDIIHQAIWLAVEGPDLIMGPWKSALEMSGCKIWADKSESNQLAENSQEQCLHAMTDIASSDDAAILSACC